jgi:hypothetical protein
LSQEKAASFSSGEVLKAKRDLIYFVLLSLGERGGDGECHARRMAMLA